MRRALPVCLLLLVAWTAAAQDPAPTPPPAPATEPPPAPPPPAPATEPPPAPPAPTPATEPPPAPPPPAPATEPPPAPPAPTPATEPPPAPPPPAPATEPPPAPPPLAPAVVAPVESRTSARETIDFSLKYDRLPLRFRETPLAEVVRALQEATWLNVVLDPAADPARLVTFVAEGEPLAETLEALLGPLGLSARVWCDVLYVAPRDATLPELPEGPSLGALRAYTLQRAVTPLQAVLDDLANLSRLTVTLSPGALERAKSVTVTLRVRNLPLRNLLHLLCRHAGLAWAPRASGVWIHLPSEPVPPG